MKKRETFKTLFKNASITIKKIISPKSFQSKVFRQDYDEFVVILKGKAIMEIEGKKIFLPKNRPFFIPKKTKHQILSTSKSMETEWFAVYIK